MEVPVYLISGFLESGKTSFITETLKDENFSTGEKTLIIITEEGELELEDKLLQNTNSVVEVIEDEEDFNISLLSKLDNKYKPQRVIIECNGMWNMEIFYKNIKNPWMIVQIVTTINSKTFLSYFQNMKQIIVSHFLNSNMVIFNRCNKQMELQKFRRIIKGSNYQSDVYFEGEDGYIMEMTDELLPFDLTKEIIEIEDEDYGLWYIDMKENPLKYNGKKVKVKGIYKKPSNYPQGSFVHGRNAMTCCEDDISYIGFICISNQEVKIKDGEWIVITATIESKENKQYDEIMNILIVENIEKVTAPKNKLVTFS